MSSYHSLYILYITLPLDSYTDHSYLSWISKHSFHDGAVVLIPPVNNQGSMKVDFIKELYTYVWEIDPSHEIQVKLGHSSRNWATVSLFLLMLVIHHAAGNKETHCWRGGTGCCFWGRIEMSMGLRWYAALGTTISRRGHILLAYTALLRIFFVSGVLVKHDQSEGERKSYRDFISCTLYCAVDLA